MAKYECTVCGYIYDPAIGDPDAKIPPGTPFEKFLMIGFARSAGRQKANFKKYNTGGN